MVKGKRVKKRSHSSEEGSTLRDLHEQVSTGDISGDDDRDSDSTRTTDGEGSAPPQSEDEEQGLAAAARQVRYTPPPRPRSHLNASPAARPVSTVNHYHQLAGRLYEMEMYDVLNRHRETLSLWAEKYYTHLLESASPSVSVALPASSSVTSSADGTSSEASSPSSHTSVVSCPTPVQGRSPVEHDSVCQTSPESSTTVSQPVTHVTSPHEVMQCTSTSNVPSNTLRLVGGPSYREVITSYCSISASDLRGCPRLTGAPDQNVVEILDQYRILVGLKAKSVRPGDENVADTVALEHIVLIAEGTCVTLLNSYCKA